MLSDRLRIACGLLVLLLSACGGGSDSVGIPSPVPNKLIAGFVMDGPIADSQVQLIDAADGTVLNRCGASGHGRCETLSRDNGYFYFDLDQSVASDGLLVRARGGRDQATGADFTGITLQASPAFPGMAGFDLIISPISTLLSDAMARGADFALARQRVGRWLGLDASNDLLAAASIPPRLERVTLLLAKIALEMKRLDSSSDPLIRLAGLVDPERPLLKENGLADPVVLDALLRSGTAPAEGAEPRLAAALAGICALNARLAAAEDNLPDTFVEEELFQALGETLSVKLAEAGTFDGGVPLFVANGHQLVRAIRQAAASRKQLIPLNGVVPQRLIRYALLSYGLETFDDFSQPEESFRARLAGADERPALAENPKIAELASISALHSVETPLLARDLPGNDNLKRLTYYYNSDRSHLYQAEKLVGRISDDLVNDAILLEIVAGKAKAGLFADAEQIIDTQMYQSQFKGMGYVELAAWLNSFARFAEADRVLQIGYPIYRRYLDLVPPTSLAIDDINTIYRYSAHFRKAGNLVASQQIFADMLALSALNPSLSLVGRMIIASRDYVAELLAAGLIEEARAQIEAMHGIADQTPANASTSGGISYAYFKARVYYLVVTATAYAELGDREGVWQLYREIQALRSSDGLANLTANETWFYMVELVEDLYRSGWANEALALAASIPVDYLNYAGLIRSALAYQASAYVTVATYEALDHGFAAGLAVIDQHFTSVEDKIDALTYFALNKEVEHVGLALLQAGQLQQGVMALDEAVRLLDGFAPGSDADLYRVVIQYGYVKLADLYHLAGDDVRTRELLDRALRVAAQLSDPILSIDAELDLAREYALIGDADQAYLRLEAANSKALACENTLGAEQAAGAYQSVIDAHLELRSGYPLAHLVDRLLVVAGNIYDNARVYSGTAHDTEAKKEIGFLLDVAAFRALIDDKAGALAALEQAKTVAREIFVEGTRMDQLSGDPSRTDRPGIVGGLATAGFVDEAIGLAEDSSLMPFFSSRNLALQKIAQVLSQRDAFPETEIASVDTDDDGLPDFFNPVASAGEIALSGLELDPDSDGDGLNDSVDLRPLWDDRND